jgi:hypothetical protein
VEAELVMLVPVELVCQYHKTEAGGVPLAVIVTPGGLHWGEFDVGVGGTSGAIALTAPFIVILSFVHAVFGLLAP